MLELDQNGTAGGSTSTELLRRQLGSANEKVHDLEVAAEKKQQVETVEAGCVCMRAGVRGWVCGCVVVWGGVGCVCVCVRVRVSACMCACV